MKLLQDFKIVIDEKEVLRYQGYKGNLPPKDNIAKILTNEIDEGYHLIKPQAVYTQVGVAGIDNGIIKLDDGSILKLGSSIQDFRNSSYTLNAIRNDY